MQSKLERYYIPEPNSGCWLWIGALRSTGYGCVSVEGKVKSAHRVSYEVYKGPIGDLHVCHTCDNPPCINPDHLWLGTNRENALDRERKGRMPHVIGEKHGRSKITENDVRNILSLNYPSRGLARIYGVSPKAIRLIRKGVNWPHVKSPSPEGQS